MEQSQSETNCNHPFTGPQSVEQSQSETNCNHPHTETTEQMISEGKDSGANEKAPVDEFFEVINLAIIIIIFTCNRLGPFKKQNTYLNIELT